MRINNFIRKILGRINKLLSQKSANNNDGYPVKLYHSGKKKRKTALFSYIPNSLLIQDQKLLTGHSNKWESREIAHILFNMGYDIDAISWLDLDFIPQKQYDIIFDIHMNLSRLDKYSGENTIKLLHCTGSAPLYQNQAEIKRVEEVNKRKNGNYLPKRIINELEDVLQSIEIADFISLIGNKHTLSTYPEEYQKKINLVTVSASDLGSNIKDRTNFVPSSREFLWFFGGGAVHKGLDRVLEVFKIHPELKLHIVGNVSSETDFVDMYKEELYNTDNIQYHGYLLPTSQEFHDILDTVFCFVAPTCSESISTAVATCLQIGLFPILSYDTGITLPDDCGIYLETSDIDEIEKGILHSYDMCSSELIKQISIIQEFALNQYSREQFSEDMKKYLQKIL